MTYQNRIGQIALAAIAAGTLSVAAYAQPHDPSDFGGPLQASAVSVSSGAEAVSVASYAQPRDPSDFGGPLQASQVSVEQPLQRVASLKPAWETPAPGHGSEDSARSVHGPWYR